MVQSVAGRPKRGSTGTGSSCRASSSSKDCQRAYDAASTMGRSASSQRAYDAASTMGRSAGSQRAHDAASAVGRSAGSRRPDYGASTAEDVRTAA